MGPRLWEVFVFCKTIYWNIRHCLHGHVFTSEADERFSSRYSAQNYTPTNILIWLCRDVGENNEHIYLTVTELIDSSYFSLSGIRTGRAWFLVPKQTPMRGYHRHLHRIFLYLWFECRTYFYVLHFETCIVFTAQNYRIQYVLCPSLIFPLFLSKCSYII
jgi:hypothetical protein